MTDDPKKKRLAKAVKRAAEVLVNSNYSVTIIQGGLFNLEALREREIRKIRVVLDDIEAADESRVRALKLPFVCSKEIWCKRLNESSFVIKEIK